MFVVTICRADVSKLENRDPTKIATFARSELGGDLLDEDFFTQKQSVVEFQSKILSLSMIRTPNSEGSLNFSNNNDSPLLTVREVAAMLRVSPSLVYRLVEAGKLGCFRIGQKRGAIRVSRDSVNQFLAASQAAPSAQKTDRTPRASLRHLKL